MRFEATNGLALGGTTRSPTGAQGGRPVRALYESVGYRTGHESVNAFVNQVNGLFVAGPGPGQGAYTGGIFQSLVVEQAEIHE
jgi:hypothetical protein